MAARRDRFANPVEYVIVTVVALAGAPVDGDLDGDVGMTSGAARDEDFEVQLTRPSNITLAIASTNLDPIILLDGLDGSEVPTYRAYLRPDDPGVR